jgi:hypothetical protein
MSNTTEMPSDLAAILSDPGVVVRQDAGVFDLIARWVKAPTATASETPTVTYDARLLRELANRAQATRSMTGAS